ncbi:NACHT domain protein [Aspergillus aurantiobrunneus]
MSGILDSDSVSNTGMSYSYNSRRSSSKRFTAAAKTNISSVVSALQRRRDEELGAVTAASLVNGAHDHDSLLDWIGVQRTMVCPAEGSEFDKVLSWAQIFIGRLNCFEQGIHQFAGDSYLAAELAYGDCAMILELAMVNRDNAKALMTTFGFFNTASSALANLLDRTELFSVSHDIREELENALGDLVTLVARVATFYHNACRQSTSEGFKVGVNLYEKFSGPINSFRQRCVKIEESMWRHQLLRDNLDAERLSEVKAIKSWLAPEDPVLTKVAANSSHLAHDREELTCLWLGPYLTRFLNGSRKSLAIYGPPGSGKTVLASVINDHLQHKIGGVQYKTVFVPINGRVQAQRSPRAVVRNLLSQLFQSRIGNVQLFHALSDAYEQCKVTTNSNDYDNILWNALDRGLASAMHGSNPLVIVVDGVDEASCAEELLLERLNAATLNGTGVKLVTLGGQKPQDSPTQVSVEVTDDLIFDDVCAVVRKALEDYENLVGRIAKSSGGSFLWGKLVTKRVRNEQTPQALTKATDSILAAKPTITDLVLYFLQGNVPLDAKQMLLWLATADRPLHLTELSVLANIRTDKQIVTDEPVNPWRVLSPLNALVFGEDDLLYLRHGQIRTVVLDTFAKGKLIPNLQDNHADLVTRLLIYIKTTVTEKREPSLTSLDWFDVNPRLGKYPLLDFALRYFIPHLQRTTAFVKGGETGSAKEISKFFPQSISAPLVAATVWETVSTPVLVTYNSVFTSFCRQILTPKHLTTLQATIFLALLFRRVDNIAGAIILFHEVAMLSKDLLGYSHIVTMQTATTFLDLTATQVSPTKNDIMVKRGEIYSLLIQCYKSCYGATSGEVIEVMRLLVSHYHTIQDEQNAEATLACIESIGSSEQAQGGIGKLKVHLVGGERQAVSENINTLALEVEEHDEVIQITEFEVSIQQAEKYCAEGRIELSERIYVEILQRVAKEFRQNASAVWEERKRQVVLAYSKFLHSQKREHEACSILSSFWQENDRNTVTESSMSHFQEIAKVMKAVGLSTTALAVFKQCSEYYHSVNLTQSSSYKEIEQLLQSTSKEVMHSSSEFFSSETAVEEIIYEAAYSASKMDQSAYKTTESLVEHYVSQHRWKDAIHVIKRVLRGVWPALFASSLQDVVLPSQNPDHCVALAEQLSRCYRSRRRLTKEQDVLTRIYRALRTGRNVEDKRRQDITSLLLHVLERDSRTDLTISIYQELLNDYKQHYSPKDAKVIDTLWKLAQLTRPRPIFVDYYEQIIESLNKGTSSCHPQAFEPLGRYADALHHYKIIFNTFLEQPKLNPKLQHQAFIREIFNRYTHCLRTVSTEFTTIHQITEKYQSMVKTVFSATASITIQATLTLAKLCQESKTYELQAIRLYEELIKINAEELDMQEIYNTLESIYEEQATLLSDSNTSNSISSEQVNKAATALKKRVTHIRDQYGWAHEQSLTAMQQMVRFYAQRNETQTVISDLQQATVNILSEETSFTKLSIAAAAIASSYIACNQTHKVTELREEIYQQVKTKRVRESRSLKVDLASKDRQSLVFLAQLEHKLSRQTSSITEILASLMSEYIYFEEFRKQFKSKSSTLHSITLSTARLHQHLIIQGRQEVAAQVVEDFTAHFTANEGKRIQLLEAAQVKVFISTLLQHFTSHRSQSFIRSVGIMGNTQVTQLLQSQKYDMACDLAVATFKYLSAQEDYSKSDIVKFAVTLGVTISGRDVRYPVRANDATSKKLLAVSATILRSALGVVRDLKISLAQVNLEYLNVLVGLLGEQQEYKTLVWLLSTLWTSREARRTWKDSVVHNLGHRFILARYLADDFMGALRLAEDIVYNYRRVYSPCDSSTLQLTVLLSQLYTGIAAQHSARKGGEELAARHYRKSIVLHENVLRSFSDASFAELDGSVLDGSIGGDGPGFEENPEAAMSEGEHVLNHIKLLKLSAQRLGTWPKDASEYNRLHKDLVREYPEEMKGVEPMDQWSFKGFGGGKAESNDDQLDATFGSWQLFTPAASVIN